MSRVFYFIFFLSFPALSDEMLGPIEVVAEKTVSDFHFGSSENISVLELENAPVGLASAVLKDPPGVVSNQSGGPGSRASYFIRGTESKHVSFSIDGLKINDPSNIDRQFDSAFMTTAFLKEIDIHKGPQAVLFGPDAMGGLVEMKSRKGENAPEKRLSVNAGSFGTLDTSFSGDWKTDDNQGTLTVSKFRTDGISRFNEKRFDAKERDASDITQLTSSSSHRWRGKWQTDILLSWLRGKNELDLTSDNTYDESQNDQYLLQQKTTYELSSNSALSLRNGLSRHQRFNQDLDYGDTSFAGDLIQSELLYERDVKKLHLVLGAGTEHEELKLTGLDRSNDLHSAFLQTLWRLELWRLQVGIRAENHTQYGSFYTGSGGLSRIFGSHTLSIQYSEGFKPPSLFQLHSPDFGNDKLRPERNHSWDLRWSWMQDNFKNEVVLFQNRLTNLIAYTGQGYRNQSHFIAEGVELSGSWQGQSFKITPTFTHQNFRKEEASVLGRPNNMATLGVAWFPVEAWELAGKLRWFDSRKDVDPIGNPVKLNGYETLDLGVRFVRLKDEYGVQLLNVFDREYEELYGYSVMPRSVFFHYGLKI